MNTSDKLEEKQVHRLGGRQLDVFRAVCEFLKSNYGIPPTVRDIGDMVGVDSTSMINYYVTRLIKAGYLFQPLPDKNTARNIMVVGGYERALAILDTDR